MVLLAALLHLSLLAWIAFTWKPSDTNVALPARTLAVEIVPANRTSRRQQDEAPESQLPEPLISELDQKVLQTESVQQVPPPVVVEQSSSRDIAKTDEPVSEKRQEQTETASRVTFQQIIGQLDKYRIDGSRGGLPEPTVDPAPITFSGRPRQNMLTMLDKPMPELPFPDSPLELDFYPQGIRGDMARLGDALTQEFGFVTKYGTKVQCVYVLVVVSCGWN